MSALYYDQARILVENLLSEELSEIFVNVGPDLRHVDSRVPSHHGLPIWSHQKLLEVPLDVIDLQRAPEQPFGVPKAVPNRWAGILHGRKLKIIEKRGGGNSRCEHNPTCLRPSDG